MRDGTTVQGIYNPKSKASDRSIFLSENSAVPDYKPRIMGNEINAKSSA